MDEVQSVSSGPGSSRRSAFLPAIYLQLLCEVSENFGIAPAELQRILGLSREQLLEPDRLVPIAAARAATEYAFSRAGSRGLGYTYALALSVTLHGPLEIGQAQVRWQRDNCFGVAFSIPLSADQLGRFVEAQRSRVESTARRGAGSTMSAPGA